ncbi:MAG: polysaccharide biosynthesis protein, partial [Oscillospiraceae bacterium]|nr:polysaccharide biosynthesis protein [Oscillospiraceae bacterium]
MWDLTRSDKLKRMTRTLALVLLDIILINAASLIALYSHFDFIFAPFREQMPSIQFFVLQSALIIALFIPMKLYNSVWIFAGVQELLHIVVSAVTICAAQYLLIFADIVQLPSSYPLHNALYLTALICASRFSYRLLRMYRRKSAARPGQKRTMLVGAGDAGMQVLKEFQTSVNSKNRVVCIVDDDSRKTGQYVCNVKIAGTREDIARLVQQHRVEEIVYAIPSTTATDRKEILNICKETGCKMKILPGISQLANAEVSIQKIRDVDVLDLLGRDSIDVDISQIAQYIRNKTVLVTGGGGSIGSELCRQIVALAPRKLLIFDIYENNAYEIQQELRRSAPGLDLVVRIGSVQDTARVDSLFREFSPDIVFHAAAHKHVPLMENSPNEAIKNNVFGTRNVARAADRYGVETFVLISTDKAVNPTNVMGASKRICEMIVQMMANQSKTKFVAVRFGNVLGSNGSVIPLFRKQIEEGGPLTVTHPDVIRYFMTIPEAVSLVLQAGAYANRGEIFVLDMGEPVRIDDLARNLIRLSGFEPDVEIEIQYSGLRPGEKLYEELLMDEEGLQSTKNQLIYIG